MSYYKVHCPCCSREIHLYSGEEDTWHVCESCGAEFEMGRMGSGMKPVKELREQILNTDNHWDAYAQSIFEGCASDLSSLAKQMGDVAGVINANLRYCDCKGLDEVLEDFKSRIDSVRYQVDPSNWE